MRKLTYSETLLILCTLILLSTHTHSKYFSSTYSPQQNWTYVGYFCFGPGQGKVEINTTSINTRAAFSFYQDTDYWLSISTSPSSCSQKALGANHSALVTHSNTQHVWIKNTTSPQYWYIAVSVCGEDSGNFSFQYNLEITNPGSNYFKQFSYDEKGILTLYIISVLCQISVVSFLLYGFWIKRNSKPPLTTKLTTVALFVFFLSEICYLTNYSIYASDGIGSLYAKFSGSLLSLTGTILLILIIFVLIEGWGQGAARFLVPCKIRFSLLCLFLGCFVVIYIWQSITFDPAHARENSYLPQDIGQSNRIIAMSFFWALILYHIQKGSIPLISLGRFVLAVSLWLSFGSFAYFFCLALPGWWNWIFVATCQQIASVGFMLYLSFFIIGDHRSTSFPPQRLFRPKSINLPPIGHSHSEYLEDI
eukprot:TRINITY_DN8439_c0_g1_i1.p1 TRINITY_DN8439_c0_g1~~TRINITY_DN8439_c0_g1_i1.p1  ORF type:complete len:421 (-),score=0.53 TRINITY_DN8439_c0_g1_i1:152-1414(-)